MVSCGQAAAQDWRAYPAAPWAEWRVVEAASLELGPSWAQWLAALGQWAWLELLVAAWWAVLLADQQAARVCRGRCWGRRQAQLGLQGGQAGWAAWELQGAQ